MQRIVGAHSASLMRAVYNLGENPYLAQWMHAFRHRGAESGSSSGLCRGVLTKRSGPIYKYTFCWTLVGGSSVRSCFDRPGPHPCSSVITGIWRPDMHPTGAGHARPRFRNILLSAMPRPPSEHQAFAPLHCPNHIPIMSQLGSFYELQGTCLIMLGWRAFSVNPPILDLTSNETAIHPVLGLAVQWISCLMVLSTVQCSFLFQTVNYPVATSRGWVKSSIRSSSWLSSISQILACWLQVVFVFFSQNKPLSGWLVLFVFFLLFLLLFSLYLPKYTKLWV